MGMSLKSIVQGTSINKAVSKASPFIGAFAFVEQLTEKDRGALFSSSAPMEQKAAMLVDIIVGRITGYSVFNLVRVPRTFQPVNAVMNKYVGFWLSAEIANIVADAVFPAAKRFTRPFLRVARIAVVPGAIGGLFDDPKGGRYNKRTDNDSVENRDQKAAMYYHAETLARMR